MYNMFHIFTFSGQNIKIKIHLQVSSSVYFFGAKNWKKGNFDIDISSPKWGFCETYYT